MIMRSLLILPFSLCLFVPVQARGCELVSEIDRADRRFNLFDSDIALLNASEGFFKIGDKCRKVFPYIGWAD